MKRSLCSLVVLAGCATAPVQPIHVASAAPAISAPALSENQKRFGGLDVFGARHEPVEQLLAAFDMPPIGTVLGHPNPIMPKLMAGKEQIVKRFTPLQCHINFAMFADQTEYVVVEWVDQGDEWRLKLDAAPTGHVADPGGLLAAWKQYRTEYEILVDQRELPELNPDPDHDLGSCKGAIFCEGGFAHPKLAPLEQRFIDGVPRSLDELARVIREDADPERRFDAVGLLAYGRSREAIVQALLPAVRDPDQGVRNLALQMLGADQRGLDHVILPLDPLLDALWFPEESDRNKAGWALVRVTAIEHGAQAAQIARKAGEALAVMAGMHSRLDYEPAQRVLRAISGEDHGSDTAAWRAWVARASR